MMLKIDNPLVLVVYWTGGGVKRNQIWYIFFQSPLPLGYTHPNPAPTPLRRKGKNIGIFQGSLSAPRFFLLYFTETFWNQNFRVPYFSAVMPPPPPNPTDYHALNNEPSRKCVQTNQTNVEYSLQRKHVQEIGFYINIVVWHPLLLVFQRSVCQHASDRSNLNQTFDPPCL